MEVGRSVSRFPHSISSCLIYLSIYQLKVVGDVIAWHGIHKTALVAYKVGEFQEAFQLALRSQAIFPEHAETKELLKTLRQQLAS